MSRTRSTIILNEIPEYHWIGRDKDGTIRADYTYYGRHWKLKEITDVLTPSYWTQLRSGEFMPINPVTISTTEHVVLPGGGKSTQASSFSPPSVVEYTGNFDNRALGYSYLGAYLPDTSDIDAVVIRALAKAKTPDFDLLTNIGELPETVRLLRNNANRFRSLLNGTAYRAFKREVARARRGKRKYNAKRALKDFTSLWLEARYGWRPLIGAMEDLVKALDKKLKSDIQRATAKQDYEIDDEFDDQILELSDATYVTSFKREGKCTIRAKVYHRSQMSSFGFNPVVSAWELTRLSFVLDWFINIGGWLTAISPRVGYGHLGTSVSIKVEYTDVYKSVHTGKNGWSTNTAVGGEEFKFQTYTRFNYVDPLPLPSIQIRLDWLKGLDLAALAYTMRSDVWRVLRL